MLLHIVPVCREVIQPAPCSSAAQRDDGFVSIRFGLCQRLKHFRYPWSDIHSYHGSRVIAFIAIRPFESCFLRYLNQRRLYFLKAGSSRSKSPSKSASGSTCRLLRIWIFVTVGVTQYSRNMM